MTYSRHDVGILLINRADAVMWHILLSRESSVATLDNTHGTRGAGTAWSAGACHDIQVTCTLDSALPNHRQSAFNSLLYMRRLKWWPTSYTQGSATHMQSRMRQPKTEGTTADPHKHSTARHSVGTSQLPLNTDLAASSPQHPAIVPLDAAGVLIDACGPVQLTDPSLQNAAQQCNAPVHAAPRSTTLPPATTHATICEYDITLQLHSK